MATKAEEEAARLMLSRIAEGISEGLRGDDARDVKIATLEAQNVALLAKVSALETTIGHMLPIVAQFADSMRAELAEAARIKAERVAGKSAVLALVSDARVMAVIVSLITGVCVAILSYLGVLPHATN